MEVPRPLSLIIHSPPGTANWDYEDWSQDQKQILCYPRGLLELGIPSSPTANADLVTRVLRSSASEPLNHNILI